MRFLESGRLWVSNTGCLFLANPPSQDPDDPADYDDRDHDYLGPIDECWDGDIPERDRDDFRYLLDEWQDAVRFGQGTCDAVNDAYAEAKGISRY